MTPDSKSFLVTGGTGFIGRRLVSALSAANTPTYCLLRPGHRARGQMIAGPGVALIEVGGSGTTLEAIVSDTTPDVVVNLAAAGVDPGSRDSRSLVADNVEPLTDLLLALSKSPPLLFLHIGTWSEYADPIGTEPIKEDHPLSPRSIYGAAKAAAFMYGNALAQDLGIPFVTLRLFNVFGPGEAAGRLVPYLIDRLSQFEPAELTSGEQVRDFTYVDDVVDAILSASDSALDPYQAFNICSGRGVTVKEVAETVAESMQRPLSLLRFGAMSLRADEPVHVVGVNERFIEATQWRPRRSLPEGVRLSVEAADDGFPGS